MAIKDAANRAKVKIEDLPKEDVFEALGKPAAHRGIGRADAPHRIKDALEKELESSRCHDPKAVAEQLEALGGKVKGAKRARTAQSSEERAAEQRG